MSEPIKIASLLLENVKRVKAVSLTPTPNGLTILGGRNGQGKTSVLDSIAWALGGDKYRPSNPQRDESVLPPQINVKLSNGLIVERKGKNSALTVTDPQGRHYGQTLLNEFVNTFAIDLPRFLEASDKEKAETLLQIIGVGAQLRDLETRERDTYNQRHAIGQLADQKAKFAKEMPLHEGVPDAPISAGDLIRQQQDILLRNAENQRKRERRSQIALHVESLTAQMEELRQMLLAAQADLATAERDALDLHDESTAELEETPLANNRLCDGCDKCIHACPGHALDADGKRSNWQCAVYYNGANRSKNPFMPASAYADFPTGRPSWTALPPLPEWKMPGKCWMPLYSIPGSSTAMWLPSAAGPAIPPAIFIWSNRGN